MLLLQMAADYGTRALINSCITFKLDDNCIVFEDFLTST